MQKKVAANGNVPASTRITINELARQSGLDEDTLLKRIAEVMNQRADDTIDKLVSTDTV